MVSGGNENTFPLNGSVFWAGGGWADIARSGNLSTRKLLEFILDSWDRRDGRDGGGTLKEVKTAGRTLKGGKGMGKGGEEGLADGQPSGEEGGGKN